MFPQIEEPHLDRIEEKVLECLKKRKEPQLPLGIATKLNINENSVRRALFHLKQLNMVYQPIKKLRLQDLNSSGKIDYPLSQKNSYAAMP